MYSAGRLKYQDKCYCRGVEYYFCDTSSGRTLIKLELKRHREEVSWILDS